VADALRADGVEVAFIGADRAEAQLVPAAGDALHRIAVQGMSRTNPFAPRERSCSRRGRCGARGPCWGSWRRTR